MAARKGAQATNGPARVVRRAGSCEVVLRRVLSKAPDIDAVFLLKDASNVLHVFSVVRDFRRRSTPRS